MGVLHQDAIIANGASETGEIDVTDRVVIGIEIPAAWTAATLAITAAQKPGGTFVPVFDKAGAEIEYQAGASRMILLDPNLTRPLRVMKINSGPSTLRVNQGAARTINIVTTEDDRI